MFQWSRRHIRQKFCIPEDPEEMGYRRNWLSAPPYTPETMFVYENKGTVFDSDERYGVNEAEIKEKHREPSAQLSDYNNSNGVDYNTVDDGHSSATLVKSVRLLNLPSI